ncbi:uncharacterized protein LOC110978048 isoform X2 [Acanthaster planci]|nr:uncharacterized protein LOC110978048 isoform X2 [Acanthaster planci]
MEHQACQLHKMLREQDGEPAGGQRSHRTEEHKDPKASRADSEQGDIEMEELDEGHYAPTRQITDLTTGPRFVQMDNFVEDAELSEEEPGADDDDADFASCQYESSFKIVDSSSASPLKLTGDLVRRIGGADDGEDDKLEISQGQLEVIGGGGCEMRTLPGEAEEQEEVGVSSLSNDAVHQTELDMSTRRSPEAVTPGDSPPSEMGLEISSDEVQPFSLDTDFDYDNVSLTPKWDSNHGPPGWKPGL